MHSVAKNKNYVCDHCIRTVNIVVFFFFYIYTIGPILHSSFSLTIIIIASVGTNIILLSSKQSVYYTARVLLVGCARFEFRRRVRVLRVCANRSALDVTHYKSINGNMVQCFNGFDIVFDCAGRDTY